MSATGASTSRRPWLLLALLALPSLLIAIDISVLTIALPRMSAALHPSPTELLWMNDIYGFMVGGTMIVMGGIGDRFGRRRLVVTCAAVFGLASTAAAFSTEPWMLIGARAVMGIAGAAIMPSSMALIGQLFPDPKQSMAAMGAFMTCFLGGIAIAPLIGGLMIEHWWWGSVFLLGVPVMLVTVAAAPRLLPEYRDPSGARPDLRSAALCLGSILLVVYALKAIVNNGWSPQVLIVGAMGLTAGVVFVRRQRRLSDPLVDLDLLRSPGVARTLTVLFLTALVMGGTSLFVSFYLQTVQGLSPLRSALWLLPQMGAMIISANVGPRLAQRIDPNRMLLASLSSMTVGFALFALVPLGHGGMYVLVTASVLTTGGVGAAFPQLMNSVILSAPTERAASVASLTQTANEIGIAVGLVVFGSIGALAYRSDLRATTGRAEGTWVDGLRAARSRPSLLPYVQNSFTTGFHIAAMAAVAVLLVALAIQRKRRPTEAVTFVQEEPATVAS